MSEEHKNPTIGAAYFAAETLTTTNARLAYAEYCNNLLIAENSFNAEMQAGEIHDFECKIQINILESNEEQNLFFVWFNDNEPVDCLEIGFDGKNWDFCSRFLHIEESLQVQIKDDIEKIFNSDSRYIDNPNNYLQ